MSCDPPRHSPWAARGRTATPAQLHTLSLLCVIAIGFLVALEGDWGRWFLAALHLVAFGIGLSAIWTRTTALRGLPDPGSLRRALRADVWWGVAALLWLGTGLPRLLAGLEKPTAYYLGNHVFWLKMLLFVIIVLLELTPAVTLGQWRGALRRGRTPDTALAPRLVAIGRLETGLVFLALFAATAVARGFGG